MFTDIVGYTALMAESEQRGLAARERHLEVVRPLVARHHGELIDSRGDDSLSVFPSALDAVHCALAIEEALQDDAELKLHIGIHSGDVILTGGNVSGDGVNIASRICSLSRDGGICVSAEIYRSIRNQPGIEAISLGPQRLKNVSQRVAVYAVGRPGAVARPVTPTRPGFATAALVLAVVVAVSWWGWNRINPPLGPIRSLAVLPLENLTEASGHDYFSLGLTEALISELGKLEELRVISRTSVMPYRETEASIGQIAADLGVEAIIEGSVLRVGDRVRITAQLIDARRDDHLWAESYERELSDILALQQDIAREIAQQIQLEVSPPAQVAAGPPRRVNPEAYEAYLKGYHFQMQRTRESTLKAVAYYEEVIRLDPESPLGYSGLADEYSCVPTHSWSITESELWPSVPREMIGKARENALKAVLLDPNSGAAHNSIALVRLFGDWDWPGAEAEFLKALELTPNREWAHSTYGLFLAFMRRFDESLWHLEKARSLDPLRIETTMDRALIYTWRGEPDRAYAEWKAAQEIDPAYPGLHQSAITRFCGTEAHGEALAALEAANRKYSDDPLILAELAYCHAVSGRQDVARKILREVEAHSASTYVSPVARALVHVGLGELELAFEALERAYRDRDFLLLYVGIDPPFEPLRDDPRFADLLDRIGLPHS